ncbi:MAG: phenylacetic acid degradation operon negative regulatory protein [Parcubacteria group bacterium LiPW_39]|nr:MAG: phenylacetic acid degradation operon negative regulatory protein [Parcubacteria group bacterium LiPW_39]
MRGQKLIKAVDLNLLREISADYRQLIFKKRLKENLLTLGQISAQVLLVVGVLAGTITLAAIAPNVIGAVGRLMKKGKRRPYYFQCDQKKFNRALSYLKNQHLIKMIPGQRRGTSLRLTPKGERKYCIHLLDRMSLEKPKKWDGRWRIVIFDIPEKFKMAREAIRQKLQNLGFCQIQKSVFAVPYPCEKEINFIRHLFGLEDQLRIIRADFFQGEQEVKETFGLN